MKKNLTLAAAAGILAVSAASVHAQLNLTGGSIAGQLVNQQLTEAFPNVGAFNGTVSSWVINGATADTLGLIYVYQVVNSGPSAINNAEFTGFTPTEVISAQAYSSITGMSFGAAPSADGNFPFVDIFGGTATFENGQMNTGGHISYYLAVLTNTRTFAENYGQIQDHFTATGSILAPAPVPEPGTILAGALMLLPLGIGAIRALRKEHAQ
jgi:hypothetical protein